MNSQGETVKINVYFRLKKSSPVLFKSRGEGYKKVFEYNRKLNGRLCRESVSAHLISCPLAEDGWSLSRLIRSLARWPKMAEACLGSYCLRCAVVTAS
ncbi:hypothetical protein TNCV_164551 [Trichonephila clavipes]|nr:hypothetical protein TNCV_164551 [Trichonephila clavipes]